MQLIDKYLKPKTIEEIRESFKNFKPNELLILSSYHGLMEGLENALQRGADVHVYKDLALVYAASGGHLEAVKLLIENGANVNENKHEALVSAAAENYKDIINLMIDNGAKMSKEEINDIEERGTLNESMITFIRSKLTSDKNKYIK